jgi:hypothetical protein
MQVFSVTHKQNSLFPQFLDHSLGAFTDIRLMANDRLI